MPRNPHLAALALAVALLAAPADGATIAVTTDLDTDLADALCSLREAIVAANTDAAYRGCAAGSGPDRIVFPLATPATILLGADLPTVTGTLKLQGPGADLLTVDGQDTWRLLDFQSPAAGLWLGVEGLTLARGADSSAGAIYAETGKSLHLRQVRLLANVSTGGGGAVTLQGSETRPSDATFIECELDGNEATGPAGGGGVHLSGPGVTARIEATTLSDNRAAHANGIGGGILAQEAALTFERSTLSNNRANSSGGAIYVRALGQDSSVTILDSTMVGNMADADGSGTGDGGAISGATGTTGALTVVARNSLLATNEDSTAPFAPDLHLNGIYLIDWQSGGFNLVGSVAGAESFVQAGVLNPDGDQVGTAASPIDPRLEPLADNGGFAPTLRPLLEATSPVIDQGSCPTATGDQRGGAGGLGAGRIANLPSVPDGPGDRCDIGAVERLSTPGAASPLFADAFETGHTLLWSGERP